MEVRIGVTYTPKEIEVELDDDTNRDQLITAIEDSGPLTDSELDDLAGGVLVA